MSRRKRSPRELVCLNCSKKLPLAAFICSCGYDFEIGFTGCGVPAEHHPIMIELAETYAKIHRDKTVQEAKELSEMKDRILRRLDLGLCCCEEARSRIFKEWYGVENPSQLSKQNAKHCLTMIEKENIFKGIGEFKDAIFNAFAVFGLSVSYIDLRMQKRFGRTFNDGTIHDLHSLYEEFARPVIELYWKLRNREYVTRKDFPGIRFSPTELKEIKRQMNHEHTLFSLFPSNSVITKTKYIGPEGAFLVELELPEVREFKQEQDLDFSMDRFPWTLKITESESEGMVRSVKKSIRKIILRFSQTD